MNGFPSLYSMLPCDGFSGILELLFVVGSTFLSLFLVWISDLFKFALLHLHCSKTKKYQILCNVSWNVVYFVKCRLHYCHYCIYCNKVADNNTILWSNPGGTRGLHCARLMRYSKERGEREGGRPGPLNLCQTWQLHEGTLIHNEHTFSLEGFGADGGSFCGRVKTTGRLQRTHSLPSSLLVSN